MAFLLNNLLACLTSRNSSKLQGVPIIRLHKTLQCFTVDLFALFDYLLCIHKKYNNHNSSMLWKQTSLQHGKKDFPWKLLKICHSTYTQSINHKKWLISIHLCSRIQLTRIGSQITKDTLSSHTDNYLPWIISLVVFRTGNIFLNAHLQIVYCNCVKFHQ